MSSLYKFFLGLMPLPKECRLDLEAVLQRKEYPKGHILIRPYTVSDHLFYIEKGLTRTYYMKAGREVTNSLDTENQFAGSIVSFITRRPEKHIVEVLEPSVFWTLHHADLENLLREYPELERWSKSIAVLGMIQMQDRLNSLQFSTAQERYLALMDNNPGLLQRVPLGIIASYLGITQETLSRIRSQVKMV